MVAAAVVGGAVVGGVLSSDASRSAANTQADAANRAADLQMQQFQQMQANQQPYTQVGSNALNQYQQLINSGQLTPNFSFNPSDLSKTPGYQFALQQGLRAATNSAAAKGLGYSGSQIKGAENFATGLADQTYNQQYQNALNSFNTNYQVQQANANRLSGLVGLGQNAAAGVGNAGLQTANNVGNALMSGAQSQAAGTIGQANALNNGIGNAFSGYLLSQNMGSNASSPSLYGSNNMYDNEGSGMWF